MKEKILLATLAAVVGGIVGAVTVLCIPSGKNHHEAVANFDELNVKKLKVSDTFFLWPEGKDDADLIMTNGGVLARNRIIATQICGNLLLGNAVFTTPDNPQEAVDQCRIFTEMGSNPNTGGAFVVRSPKGPHILSKGIAEAGNSYNIGYDNKDVLWGYALDNSTKEMAKMVFMRNNPNPETQTAPGNAESATATSATIAPPVAGPASSNQPYPQTQSPQMIAQPENTSYRPQ